MIKLFSSILLSVLIQLASFAQQKPTIDIDACNNWIWVSDPTISDNGLFAAYTINNQPLSKKTTIIQSTISDWKEELEDVGSIYFTDNGKQAIVMKKSDSLCLLSLESGEKECIPNVSSFKMLNTLKGQGLVYHLKGPNKRLVLRYFSGKKEEWWDSVNNYWVGGDGKTLLIQYESKKDGSTICLLQLINVQTQKSSVLYKGAKVQNVCFDNENLQIAFTVETIRNGKKSVSIWYYHTEAEKAIPLVNNESEGIKDKFEISNIANPGFNTDGTRLFFTIKQKEVSRPVLAPVLLNVWNYKDEKLQSEQLLASKLDPLKLSNNFTAEVFVDSKNILQLTTDNQRALIEANNDEYATISYENVNDGEVWNTKRRPPYIISTNDGRKIFECKGSFKQYLISPEGRFILYYDEARKNFFSYEFKTCAVHNLTDGLKIDWHNGDNERVIKGVSVPGAWLVHDDAVFLYDQYDIWQIDLKGEKKPINFTNGYGRRHNITFRFGDKSALKRIIGSNYKLILSAYNRNNKSNGFFSKTEGQSGDPVMLTMGQYLYFIPTNFVGNAPVKAKNANAWIVTRQTAFESPNYFFTKDFKEFKRLSFVAPERNYNWLKSELYTLKTPGGYLLQGILYKPENFDSTKKYPVILHYYEKQSHRLNLYLKPEPSDGDLNVPWYVSNGYLVFEPDIDYRLGYPGKSALISIQSSAIYLSRVPYVDSKKMGLQGISFGGFETNYAVTHTNIFSAACSSSGTSDAISRYNTVAGGNGVSNQIIYEIGQHRIGYNLWERPELFIENSPIFKANNVVTPLLIMHTTNDVRCDFSQALELFTALRRLQKPAWMLEYEVGNHSVWGKSSEDFTIRMMQFFNHYLKSAPAPTWMTQGVPARLKGIETGYTYDPSGNCAKDCKVCKKWNEKMKKDSIGTWKEIEKKKIDEHWQ